MIPFWSGYNTAIPGPAAIQSRHCETQQRIRVASYAPIIDAPPAHPATVYTTMHHSKQMTEALGQSTTLQTMDQQLYSVAQSIKWNKPSEFSNGVFSLGGFHTLSCYIGCIGKLWGTQDYDIY